LYSAPPCSRNIQSILWSQCVSWPRLTWSLLTILTMVLFLTFLWFSWSLNLGWKGTRSLS
jgi:hypothetical protein